MIEHPALQDTSVAGPPSSAATGLAMTLLAGELPLDEAAEQVGRHLLDDGRVEVFLCALTSLPPDHVEGWRQLGGRAWVREWVRPGSSRSFVPPPGAGPEAAMSMPWMSTRVREDGLAAITDRDLLPSDEAAQDIAELTRFGVRSLISSAWASGEFMFGSMSVISLDAGAWSDQLLQDFKLLNAAMTSRLALEQSRRSLAEAIEAGAEAQRATQQLFGAVGHELRTPLSAILGYTEALLDDAEHGPADDVASGMKRDGPVILRSCERLLTIVDSLLGAGRTLSGDDQRQDVVVADAIADVVHWHRTPAHTAKVEMVVEVDPAVTAWAHPAGVRQVLTNLLGNAIAHHRPSGGTVHLSAVRLLGESGREMVRIVVRDDGPGLTTEQLEHVFEPFVRFAAPTTKGSGLGLSMSRTIAERDGGAVRGESVPGAGCTFWLELPARSA